MWGGGGVWSDTISRMTFGQDQGVLGAAGLKDVYSFGL